MAGVEVVHKPRPRKPKTGDAAASTGADPARGGATGQPASESEHAGCGGSAADRRSRIDLAKLRTRANFVEAIGEVWAEAEENFTAIGRYLNHAKSVLNHGEFIGMIEADLPFHYSTANRLMKVAAALDAGALPVEKLPPSYATVYELLTLSEDERRQAIEEEGVVRPDMQRKDVTEFRKWLKAARRKQADKAADRAGAARETAE